MSHEPSPESKAELREFRMLLTDLIEKLPDDRKSLIKSAYFDGLTLKEAGERIGISKAWASRLHAKTLNELAAALPTTTAGE